MIFPCVVIAQDSVKQSAKQNASKATNVHAKYDKLTLFACGVGEYPVLLLQTDQISSKVDTVWKWHISTTKGLPVSYLPIFAGIGECKPSCTGDTLLMTSSGGAVLLLERFNNKALFYAKCAAAHSAEYLPNDRLVVVNSINPSGNSLELYDISQPEKVLFRDTLFSGHGVVWNPSEQRLYALGYKELKVYTLESWDTNKPSLKLEKIWEIPEGGGHDLYKVTDDRLLLSTDNSVWEFDTRSGQFRPFKPLEGVPNVKSVNLDPVTDLLAYTKGEIEWWTHQIHFQNPEGVIRVPQVNMYKVRFFKKRSTVQN